MSSDLIIADHLLHASSEEDELSKADVISLSFYGGVLLIAIISSIIYRLRSCSRASQEAHYQKKRIKLIKSKIITKIAMSHSKACFDVEKVSTLESYESSDHEINLSCSDISKEFSNIANTDDEIIEQSSIICPICLDIIHEGDTISTSKTRSCAHYFHNDCLKPWVFLHDECPCCRTSYFECTKDNEITKSHVFCVVHGIQNCGDFSNKQPKTLSIDSNCEKSNKCMRIRKNVGCDKMPSAQYQDVKICFTNSV